ncbi:putative nicotinate-nucleotide adenylyltransferase [Enterococcus saigonensis]|uniref:Probable nicotinate-nucleotide adenylyltransferase n=2 Tax=Enterococcus saigonensis TaxID=1805431 RepID=A0A679IBC8_9ENTE|nr:putative nicotinate-nucleotide adenylyltransferase [Enterococcus saigonensis]
MQKVTVGVVPKVKMAPFDNKRRKQVGILGGNFNPVHVMHLIIADQVGQLLGLDEVYLMPEYLPPHIDAKETISAEHRLAMLELAVEGNPRLKIEDIEIKRQGISYTIDTMKILKEKNPDVDFYFIIGGDMVAYLPKWHQIDELVKMVQFVGVKRPEYSQETPYPIIWVDIPQMDLSSSLIRKKIAQGCSARYFLPDPVLNYILEKGLYLDEI